MGMSSSQARLLSLTSRMHDIEYKAQNLEAQKLQMANESAHVYKEYENALNATKIQLKTIMADGSISYIDATYNNMIANGYQIEFQEKVKVTQATADNFNLANGNKDYFVYLETGVSGAPAGYTPIYTAEQLKNINMNGKYMLMADINLSGTEWTPIGTNGNGFTGTFDGNGHTISNFKIENTEGYAGLFGYADGATIMNIMLSDVDIDASNNCVGGLIGGARNSNISNCIISNADVKGGQQVGGLIGRIDDSIITNCSSSGKVTSETRYTGGLIGVSQRNTITNSTSSADVSGIANHNSTYGATSQTFGGFVGYLNGGTVDNCSASGNVTGIREIGGFCGTAYNANITNSSASGNVTGVNPVPFEKADPDAYNYGGFIGANSSTIENCSASGDISGFSNVGGFVGRNSSGSISSSYATGKVSGNDAVDAATGQPVSSGGLGGFVGNNVANVTNSYYNSASAGRSNAAGTSSGTLDVTDVPMNEISDNAGTTTSPSISYPKVNYKNTSAAAQEAETLYENMTFNGYEVENGTIINPADGNEDDSNWFTNMLNAGFLFIFKLDNTTGEYYQTNLATDTNLREVSDETELKKAEAKYEASMRKIDAKDKKFDTDLAALEQERNAINTEIDTLKTVAKDNVDRTFKLFS